MDKDNLQRRYTLQEWEQELALQVRQVELLGEISISEEECRQLGRLFGAFLATGQRRGLTIEQLKQEIGRRYPASFAVFLAAQGLHGYAGREGFWPGVSETLGKSIDANWSRLLGQLFEEILLKFRLPLFPDLGGRRYLDLILVHGGIPNYSLNDYFEQMLKPAVTKSWYGDMSPEELIEEWLSRSNFTIDRPVLRFLKYGDRLAQDLVERSREMAREFLESGLVPEAGQVGLPERVVSAFQRWAGEKLVPSGGEEGKEATGLRLRRPDIRLDPWGEGLVLDLPPQQIPATLSRARLEWVLEAGDYTEVVQVRARRLGYDLQTVEDALLVKRPAQTYLVSFRVEGQTRRSWRFEGSTPAQPLLLFEPSSGRLLRRGLSLPARPLWLLFPREAEMSLAGPASQFEALPRLPGEWSTYQGEGWDLSQATKLSLRYKGDSLELSVHPDEFARRPHLVGGDLLSPPSLATPTPLYLDPPPAVRIPLVGRTGLYEELSRWRLTLRHAWAAEPEINFNGSLVELRPHLVQEKDHVELPLSALLGERPLGGYVLRLRGPLGRDVELPLRLLPWLYVSGHEKLYLPDPAGGPLSIILALETEAGTRLESQDESGQEALKFLEEKAGVRHYRLSVPPDEVEARLNVVKPGKGGEVRLPVRIPLRRLRWALVGLETDSQQRHWTGQMLRRSVETLAQTSSPALLVDIGELSEALNQKQLAQADHPLQSLSLVLVDSDGQELQRLPLSQTQPRMGHSVRRFELLAFIDTIRHNPSPVVRLELELPVTGQPPLRLPVLSLSRSMIIDQVQMQVSPLSGDNLEISLSWWEPVHLRHRRVRFWSLWQPWQPPYELSIPDEAEGRLTFQAPAAQFPDGAYLVEFIVVDPWLGSPPLERPAPEATNVVQALLIDPTGRIVQLKKSISYEGPRLELFLERAYIRAYLGDLENSQADCKRCYERLEGEASLPQILALLALVQQNQDRALLAPLRLKMLAPRRVRQLLAEQAEGRLSRAEYEAYLADIPEKSLPAETCDILLTAPDENLQLLAISQLLRRGREQGVTAILERVKNNTLSDQDGVAILKLNVELAIQLLEAQLDQPAAVRLLEKLDSTEGRIVRPGHWLYSPAGWARITRIESLSGHHRLDYLVQGQKNVYIEAILRPKHEAELITIEILPDRTYISFKQAETLHRCTTGKCRGFITRDINLIRGVHNRAVHGGLSPSFERVKKLPLLSVEPIKYSTRAPREMLV